MANADHGGLPSGVPICAIGASAGAVKALREFFRHVPDDLGLAYVVITHLAPDQPSSLDEILGAVTGMGVHQVEDSPKLKPDCVYVIAPDRELVVVDGHVTARPFTDARGQRTPIDMFFISVAAVRGDGLAVILSGAGSDGALGVREMKEAGAVVFVQEPVDAEFPMMPNSAIASGAADFVAPIPRLVERLVEVTLSKDAVRSLSQEVADHHLQKIVTFLRARTGHDFSSYKRATVMRRVGRRMQVTRSVGLEEYCRYLSDNPEEAQELFGDLLISVTAFFRDAGAYEVLANEGLSQLFEDAEDGGIRAWVAGCATGEEAYSLAILLLEEAERRQVSMPIQIFATDLDEGALATARAGRYPTSIESDVAPERLERFFTREGDHYRIRKEVRDLVLFATHSVVKDPPFLRLDLISCRNLLIYLERQLQREVCALFAYGLKPGGLLFLGSAETTDAVPDLFVAVHREARLYRARARTARKIPLLAQMPVEHRPQTILELPAKQHQRRDRSVTSLHIHAIEVAAAPSILIDRGYHALHLSEQGGRFLLPSAGPLSTEVTAMVRPELRLDLRTALRRAFDHGEATLTAPIIVQLDTGRCQVLLQVTPIASQAGGPPMHALAMFLDAGPAPDTATMTDEGVTSQEVTRLRTLLNTAEARLVASRAENETAIQDLRVANEELQSINEEYRSTSEELETSKEELQSMNEELQTVNCELKSKLTAVGAAHSDLQNIVAATDIGTLFLDQKLRIRLFTPRVADVFNITSADVGRVISDFTHQLDYHGLAEDAVAVLRDLLPVEKEVQASSNRWLSLRLRPYRTIDDRIEGVVVTLLDVSALHAATERLQEARDALALATRASQLGWGTWDFETGDAGWDARGCQIIGLEEGEDSIDAWMARVRTEDRQRIKDEVAASLREERPFDLVYGVTHADGTQHWVQGTGAFMRGRDEAAARGTGLVRDVTEQRRLEETQRLLVGELNHRVKNMLSVVQSTARQTQRTTCTVDAFAEAFESRLKAISGAHAILTRRNWSGAELGDLARNALASFTSLDDGQVRIAGPRLELPPNVTISFAMALHELATNAVKYGALSVPEGRVDVQWRIGEEGVFFEWSEHDGPVVVPPTRRGFGSRLIKDGIAMELGGSVTLEFREEGLRWTVDFVNDRAGGTNIFEAAGDRG